MSKTSKKKVCIGKAHGLPASPIVKAGDYLFVAGMVPMDEEGDVIGETMEEQTRATIRNMEMHLQKAGAGLEDVVDTTCFVKDPKEFEAFSKTYGEFFPDEPPARMTVIADFVVPVKLELKAIAYKPF